MATGGAPLPDPDQSECSVCLESILTKDPRQLNCGHPFCTPCIQKLLAKNTITCPICRETTKLPSGGVEELPKYDKESTRHCGLCLRHNKYIKATHTCDKCPNNRICGSCAEMHSLFQVLMSHQLMTIKKDTPEERITNICQIHSQPLEYFCPVCLTTLCLDCIYINEHKGHESKITEIDQGVSEIKSVVDNISEELHNKKLCLIKKNQYIKSELNIMDTSAKELEWIRNTLLEQLKKTDDSTQILQGHQEVLKNILSKMGILEQTVENLEDKVHNIKASTGHLCLDEAARYIKDARNVLKVLEKPVESFTTAKYIPGNLCGQVGSLQFSFKPTLHFSSEEFTLKMPELVKEILRTGEIMKNNSPREILAAGDGTVILVNEGMTDLPRIDIEGNIVKVYKMVKPIRSATVTAGCIFVALEDKTITKVKLDESSPRVTYTPKTANIRRISGTGMKVIISDHLSNGKIYEYMYDIDQTGECVSGLSQPWFVNTASVRGDELFIVNEWGSKKVIIYDKGWKVLHTISSKQGTVFKSPQGVLITPGGKLLIADHDAHTVSVFTLDGTFLRDILTNPAISEPYGILFDSPYLWISERTPAIKVFRVD